MKIRQFALLLMVLLANQANAGNDNSQAAQDAAMRDINAQLRAAQQNQVGSQINTKVVNERTVKDPVGNSCKVTELAVISSVSAPQLATAFPASWGLTGTQEYKKNKKTQFVLVTFAWQDVSGTHGGEFPVLYKEAQKLKLQKGDKKYCQTTVEAAVEGEEEI